MRTLGLISRAGMAVIVTALPGWCPAPQGSTGAVAWEKPISRGLVYRMEVDPTTPRQLHALRLTMASPSLRWYPQLAGQTIEEDGSTKGRSTVSEIAAKEGALACLNGDFFSYDHGSPIGMTVRNGELLNSASFPRAIFAWGPKDTAMAIGAPKLSFLPPRGISTPIDSMNQPLGENGLGLITSAYGKFTPREGARLVALELPKVTLSPSTEIVATVVTVTDEAIPSVVASGRALLVANGVKKGKLDGLTPGDTVTLKTVTAGFDWEKLDSAIGGGPMLVRDGKVNPDSVEENFKPAFYDKRHPRSAIGRTSDGDIWLVAVDGRQSMSDGATIEELAGIMKRLGCQEAMNLDGGGSTALHIRGLTVNRPSDGKERPVSNALIIAGPKIPNPMGRLRLKMSSRVNRDGTAQAVVEKDGVPVPDVDVLWTARGAAWADQGGRLTYFKSGSATLYAQVYGKTLKAELEWKGK